MKQTLMAGLSSLVLMSSASCGQQPAPRQAAPIPERGDATPNQPAAQPAPGVQAETPVDAIAGADDAEVNSLEAGEQLVAEGEDGQTAPASKEAGSANIQLAKAMMSPQEGKAAATSRWTEGKNYTLISPAGKTGAPPDKVQVLEAFWYGCPHCYALEPYLENWSKDKKAPYVQFKRVPATWGPVHRFHAQLFYTLQELGHDDLHMAAFREIQIGGNPLIGSTAAETERLQTEFAKRHGIDPATFKKTYHSKEVLQNMTDAVELMKRYRFDSVPQVVVNGKYQSDVAAAGGHSQLIALINDLAAREHDKR